jgi:WD40 repeat protein
MWDIDTGKKIAEWSGWKDVHAPIAFSPDGKVFAAMMARDKSEEVVFWDIAKQKIVKRFPSADISCHRLAFSRDGKLLAFAGYYKGIVQVYDVASGNEIARFQPHNGPACLTFSDDGKTLITGGDDTALLIWDIHSKALRNAKQ